MATTTNYAWETPDDTDLVKDGAAAIRTLGSSVDTTTKALNPSTTLGDIEYRSATANTNARLGIGSTGQVLTVAGGLPSWATPASGTPSFVGCSLTKTGDQSTSNNTLTNITWDSELFDTSGFHDNSTNNTRITIPSGKAGKYLFISVITWAANSSGYRESRFTKNNNAVAYYNIPPTSSGEPSTVAIAILDLAVGDYIETKVEQSSGGSLNVKLVSLFQCQYLGA